MEPEDALKAPLTADNLAAQQVLLVNPIAPDDLHKLTTAFPLVESRGGDVNDLARSAGLSVETTQRALYDPETAAALIAEQVNAECDGRLLRPLAARLTYTMLRHLTAAVEAGELDVDDISGLLPKVHKIVEHSERIQLARGDGDDHLPIFSIVFVNGHMTGTPIPALSERVETLQRFNPTSAMLALTAINADVVEVVAVERP